MEKKMRITLYILSVLAILGLIVAAYAAAKRQGAEAAFTPESTEVLSQADAGTGVEDGEGQAEDKTGAAAEDGEGQAEDGTDADGADGKEQADDVAEAEDGRLPQSAAGTDADTDGEVTILFTGDVLFANAFKAGYDAKGIEGVVEKELLAELNDADILMVNNEFPYSDRGVPMENKQFTFRCSPSYVKALNEMGVDVVSLANNHTLDYGKEALSDTFTALDGAGILYGGAGESIERAEEVQIIEVNGKKYGFLAVSRVIPCGVPGKLPDEDRRTLYRGGRRSDRRFAYALFTGSFLH